MPCVSPNHNGRPAEEPHGHGHQDRSSPTAEPRLDPGEGAAGPTGQAHLANSAGGWHPEGRDGKGRPHNPCDNHLASRDSIFSPVEGTSNRSVTSTTLPVGQGCPGHGADYCS